MDPGRVTKSTIVQKKIGSRKKFQENEENSKRKQQQRKFKPKEKNRKTEENKDVLKRIDRILAQTEDKGIISNQKWYNKVGYIIARS